MAVAQDSVIYYKDIMDTLNNKANLGKALTMDLLWTNIDSSSDFAARDIPIDTSPYKIVFIEVAEDTTSLSFNVSAVLPRKNVRLTSFIMGNPSVWKRRDFTDAGTKIIIGSGYRCTLSESVVENNSVSIPLNIWRVR